MLIKLRKRWKRWKFHEGNVYKMEKGNNVTAESQWNNINFKEAIFTLEDVK